MRTLMLMFISFVGYSQCITVNKFLDDSFVDFNYNIENSLSLNISSVPNQPNIRLNGEFIITITADSSNGNDLADGFIIPVKIKDKDSIVLADFDFVVGNTLSNVLNDSGSKWLNDFVPYLTIDYVLSGSSLNSGINILFKKGEWARNKGYFYTDGSIVLGEWESKATTLTFELIDSSTTLLRIVDCFSSLVGVNTSNIVHAGNSSYGINTYIPNSFIWIRDNVNTPIPTVITQSLKTIKYNNLVSLNVNNNIPDTFSVSFINGFNGIYYSLNTSQVSTQDTPSEYSIHLENEPTSGYRYFLRHFRFLQPNTGTIDIFDGQTAFNYTPLTLPSVDFTSTSLPLTLFQNYTFNYTSTEGSIANYINYQYEINYAW